MNSTRAAQALLRGGSAREDDVHLRPQPSFVSCIRLLGGSPLVVPGGRRSVTWFG
jgi:hypothetical protein